MSVDRNSAGVDDVSAAAAGIGLDSLLNLGVFDSNFPLSDASALGCLLSEGGFASSPESTGIEHDYLDGDQTIFQSGLEFDQLFNEAREANDSSSQQQPITNGDAIPADSWDALVTNSEVQVS